MTMMDNAKQRNRRGREALLLIAERYQRQQDSRGAAAAVSPIRIMMIRTGHLSTRVFFCDAPDGPRVIRIDRLPAMPLPSAPRSGLRKPRSLPPIPRIGPRVLSLVLSQNRHLALALAPFLYRQPATDTGTAGDGLQGGA
jgi:hypothetical protein